MSLTKRVTVTLPREVYDYIAAESEYRRDTISGTLTTLALESIEWRRAIVTAHLDKDEPMSKSIRITLTEEQDAILRRLADAQQTTRENIYKAFFNIGVSVAKGSLESREND